MKKFCGRGLEQELELCLGAGGAPARAAPRLQGMPLVGRAFATHSNAVKDG